MRDPLKLPVTGFSAEASRFMLAETDRRPIGRAEPWLGQAGPGRSWTKGLRWDEMGRDAMR